METPMEMSPPHQFHSQPPSDPTAQNTYSAHQSPHYDIEKAHLASQGPDIQQHPALQAPFADHTPQQSATESRGQGAGAFSWPSFLFVVSDKFFVGLRGSWAYFMGKAKAFCLGFFILLAETDLCSSILLECVYVPFLGCR